MNRYIKKLLKKLHLYKSREGGTISLIGSNHAPVKVCDIVNGKCLARCLHILTVCPVGQALRLLKFLGCGADYSRCRAVRHLILVTLDANASAQIHRTNVEGGLAL